LHLPTEWTAAKW